MAYYPFLIAEVEPRLTAASARFASEHLDHLQGVKPQGIVNPAEYDALVEFTSEAAELKGSAHR